MTSLGHQTYSGSILPRPANVFGALSVQKRRAEAKVMELSARDVNVYVATALIRIRASPKKMHVVPVVPACRPQPHRSGPRRRHQAGLLCDRLGDPRPLPPLSPALRAGRRGSVRGASGRAGEAAGGRLMDARFGVSQQFASRQFFLPLRSRKG
jgi:hypothetical protein